MTASNALDDMQACLATTARPSVMRAQSRHRARTLDQVQSPPLPLHVAGSDSSVQALRESLPFAPG